MYIKVPTEIKMTDLSTGDEVDDVRATWSFHKFLTNIVLPDPAMGKGYKAVGAANALHGTFKDAKPDDWVKVEQDHYDRLKKTITDPTGEGVPLTVLSQMMPFYRAIDKALDVDEYKKEVANKNGVDTAEETVTEDFESESAPL